MKNRFFWPLLLGVALLLRLWQITAALWYDEVFSALMAGLPLPLLLEAAAGDVHPPTYYLLLSAIGMVAGAGEIAMRLPSLLASMALIPLAYRLARSLRANTTTARLVALITALAPYQLYYSIEARSYALLSLAVGLAALGLVERRYWLAVAGSLIALYLHNTGGVFLAPLWLVSLRNERRYWLAGAVVAVGYLPGLWWAVAQAGHITGNYWVPPLTSPGRLVATLDDMVWFFPKSPYVFASSLVTGLLLLLILLDARRLPRLALAALFGPLLLLALASIVWQPLLISRVMAPAALFLYILAGWVINRSPTRRWALGLLAAPVLLATLAGMITWQLGRDPVDRELAAELRQYDGIYHSSVGGAVMWRYYLPDTPQFLYPQGDTELAATLSPQTRQALGLYEIDLGLIKCATVATPAGNIPMRRWAFLYFHNPVTAPDEIEFVASTLQNYPTRPIADLRHDDTTAAALVELTPECDHAAIYH